MGPPAGECNEQWFPVEPIQPSTSRATLLGSGVERRMQLELYKDEIIERLCIFMTPEGIGDDDIFILPRTTLGYIHVRTHIHGNIYI